MKGVALRLFLTMAVFFLATGCSSFNREWSAPAASHSSGLAGRWQGTWKSTATGHRGALRCLMQKGVGETYRARFRATYAGVLNFESAVDLQAQRRGAAWIFRGHSELPVWAGGRYTYDGGGTAESFRCDYHSRWDHGTFEMERVR